MFLRLAPGRSNWRARHLAARRFARAAVAPTHERARGLIGRQRRRVGDVGDDWRSLLFGAPPQRV
jgi:hypothetical protein